MKQKWRFKSNEAWVKIGKPNKTKCSSSMAKNVSNLFFLYKNLKFKAILSHVFFIFIYSFINFLGF